MLKTILIFLIGTVGFAMIQSCTSDHDPQPSADFTFSYGDNGLVTFNLAASNTDSYLWDFGDGESSNEKSPIHVYKKNGTYNVSVRASGNGGQVSVNKELTIANLTGSILFYSHGIRGNPLDIFVDGVKVGTLAYWARVIIPECGDSYMVTADKLTEGVHKYEIYELNVPDPLSWKGTIDVVAGKCTKHGISKP